MTASNRPSPILPDESLPFDLRTVALGVWAHRWFLIMWVLASGAAGAWVGLTFAPQTWRADAVLKYDPPSQELVGGVYEFPTIQTQLNMVKVDPILDQVLEDLKLSVRPEKLASAIDIENPRDTKLLNFTARWSSPREAHAIAELMMLRFLHQERTVRNEALRTLISEMQRRHDSLSQKLAGQSTVDPDALAAYQRELDNVAKRLDENSAQTEKTAAEVTDYQEQLDQLKSFYQETLEAIASDPATSIDLTQLTHQLGRIEAEIRDRTEAAQRALLDEQYRQSFEYEQREVVQGYRSPAALDAFRNRWKQATLDPNSIPEVATLRRQAEETYALMEKVGNSSISSNPVLRNLQTNLKMAEAKLLGAQARLTDYVNSREKLEIEMEAIEGRRPHRVDNEELVKLWIQEREMLEGKIARVRSLVEHTEDFQIVSRAEIPRAPEKSYRKLGAAGAASVLVGLGVSLVLARELLCRRLRSRGDVRVRLQREVWSELPILGRALDRDAQLAQISTRLRRLTRRLLDDHPDRPVRLLVVSVDRHEGRSLIASAIARSMALQGAKVTLVDNCVSVSEPHPKPGIADFMSTSEASILGWRRETEHPGVQSLSRGSFPAAAEIVGHPRFAAALDELTDSGEVVIVDGAPLHDHAESELLATRVDGVLVVVEAERTRHAAVRAAMERLEAIGAPILGIVLNRVRSAHLDKDWN